MVGSRHGILLCSVSVLVWVYAGKVAGRDAEVRLLCVFVMM